MESKQQRAHALGNHQITRVSSSGSSMRHEQMDESSPPRPSIAVPLPPPSVAAPLPRLMLSAPPSTLPETLNISPSTLPETLNMSLSSPLPSPLPSPPDGDLRDGTDGSGLSTEFSSSETTDASKLPSVRLSDVALAEGCGVWDEEKDLMRGIVRAGNGTILSQMGPEVPYPKNTNLNTQALTLPANPRFYPHSNPHFNLHSNLHSITR